MKLSKLLELVGDNNLKFQMLHESFSNASENKTCGKITFFTEKINSQGLMNQIATGIKPQFTGMVVWIPTAKMDKALQENGTKNPAVNLPLPKFSVSSCWPD